AGEDFEKLLRNESVADGAWLGSNCQVLHESAEDGKTQEEGVFAFVDEQDQRRRQAAEQKKCGAKEEIAGVVLPDNDEKEQKRRPPEGVDRDADDFGVRRYEERAESKQSAAAHPSRTERDGETDECCEDPAKQGADE